MRETLLAMFGSKPWPFGRPLYLGSKLASACELAGEIALPTTWGTGEASQPWQPCQVELPHDYERNRPIPSGKRAPIPVNTGAAREYPARDREWPKRASVIIVGACPGESLRRFRGRRSGQLSAGAWGSSGELLGIERSESTRKRLSASKGTREAQPGRAVARIGRLRAAESLPMRRLGGGASVVVRGRESRPHGEGTQDVSFWAAKTFTNREGSR